MKSKTIINNPYVIHIMEDRKLGKKFKGVAKCLEDDIFNESKGEQIAKLKAEIKREAYKANSLFSNYKYLERFVENEKKQTVIKINALNEKIQKKYEEIAILTK